MSRTPIVAGLADPVDALGDDAQGVDVEAGVGLVEDRDRRLEQLQLEDLVALLLAAGEALVDVALGEGRVDAQARPWPRLTSLTHSAQLGRLAADGGRGRAQEVETETPGTSTGYCIARNSPARARSSTFIARTSAPSRVTVPQVTLYLGCPARE